jgi:Flp pilus assembly pilin Flp
MTFRTEKTAAKKNMCGQVFFDPKLATRAWRRAFRRGQTLVEYALILAFISIVAIGVMVSLGQQTKSLYSMITSNISSAQASH